MMMIAIKHTNRRELQGDYLDVVEQYKDYILGEYVHGLHAKDSEGNTIASPPWTLVLAYERAVRKQAVKITNSEGKPLPVALKEAWKDPTVKERYFTTPLALYAKRPAAAMKEEGGPAKGQKGKGKSKDKGKGKGLRGCHTHTPSGEAICFRFNTKGEKCKAKKCKFVHVCGSCFSDKHPLHQCSHNNKQDAADTQGTG